MATRKKVEDHKMTVSTDPDQHDDLGGAAPVDVTVDIPDVLDDAPAAPAAAGGGAGGGTPPAGPVAAPRAAGDAYSSSYGTWVVPAPAAAATAPVGSSGYFMGIRTGVDTTPGVYAMLGTSAPRAGWPA